MGTLMLAPLLVAIFLAYMVAGFVVLGMRMPKKIDRLDKDVVPNSIVLGVPLLLLAWLLARGWWKTVPQPSWAPWLTLPCLGLLAGTIAHALWIRRQWREHSGESEELRLRLFERFWKGMILAWGLALALALAVPVGIYFGNGKVGVWGAKLSLVPTLRVDEVRREGGMLRIRATLVLAGSRRYGEIRIGRPVLQQANLRESEGVLTGATTFVGMNPKLIPVEVEMPAFPAGTCTLRLDLTQVEEQIGGSALLQAPVQTTLQVPP